MKKSFLVSLIFIGMFTACKALTPEENALLLKTSATILCALEGEALDDPALNKACDDILPNLTPEQRAAVKAHIAAKKAERSLRMTANDAGIQDSGK